MSVNAPANELLNAALECAALGWRVLPVHDMASGSCSCGGKPDCTPGKHPRTPRGLKDATTDPATIREWWRQWANANVAIATGPESNVVMLGPDGEKGKSDLADLIRENGALPRAPKEVSGSGGLHLYFRHPGRKITNRRNWKGTKIDVRGDGGYSIVAPSRNGSGPYRWADHPAAVGDVPEMPAWLIEWMTTEPVKKSTPPNSTPGDTTLTDRASVIRRASAYLATMPAAFSCSGGHDATFRAACVLCNGFALSEDETYDLLAREYNPRCKPVWSEKELRHKAAEAGKADHDHPRGHLLNNPPGGESNESQASPTSGTGTNKPPQKPLDPGISLADLIALDMPPARFVLDGLFPEGFSLLASRPKMGKSWLALQIAIAVGAGRACLGAVHVEPRPVLLLALEDTRRRLKDRANKIIAATGWPITSNVTLHTSWPRAGAGGHQAIGEWYQANRGGVVIVDTLAKYRDPTNGKSNSYEADYAAVGGLKQLADAYAGAALGLHHTRKMNADDPFDEISGTLGINGACDSMQVLNRTRGSGTATVYVTGRDIAEQTVNLEFDSTTCLWSFTGRDEGIDTTNRGGADAGHNRVAECVKFVNDFLGTYAWPDKELEAAGVAAGFTIDNVRKAKTALRKDGVLSSKPAGSGGVWWNWLGGKNQRPIDRPTPTLTTSSDSSDSLLSDHSYTHFSGESHETEETEETEESDVVLESTKLDELEAHNRAIDAKRNTPKTKSRKTGKPTPEFQGVAI